MSQLFPAFEDLHTRFVTAIVACRDRSEPKAVHNLRTLSLRLESVVKAAAEQHAEASAVREASDKLLDRLKRIRRAAGDVRDIDVQRNLMHSIANELIPHLRVDNRQPVLHQAESIDRYFKRHRRIAKRKLRHLLLTAELSLERSLQKMAKLLAALPDDNPTANPATSLSMVRRWTKSAQPKNGPLTPRELHKFRKRTKTARYLAELQPQSEEAADMAKSLRNIQDSIGHWHDCDLLARQAADILGKDVALTKAIDKRRVAALKQALRTLTPATLSSPARSHRSPAKAESAERAAQQSAQP
jgi:CHAD domain-containing protein